LFQQKPVYLSLFAENLFLAVKVKIKRMNKYDLLKGALREQKS